MATFAQRVDLQSFQLQERNGHAPELEEQYLLGSEVRPRACAEPRAPVQSRRPQPRSPLEEAQALSARQRADALPSLVNVCDSVAAVRVRCGRVFASP